MHGINGRLDSTNVKRYTVHENGVTPDNGLEPTSLIAAHNKGSVVMLGLFYPRLRGNPDWRFNPSR